MATELHSRSLLLLLAAAGLAALPHFGHLPVAPSIGFLCLFGWRLLGVWRPEWLPKGAAHLALAASCLGLMAAQFDGHWGAVKGVTLFMAALSLKLLELNKKRDAYLVCYLVLILAGSMFLFSQNPFTAIYESAVCLAALSALIAINSGTANVTALRVAGRLLMQSLPITMLLFALFPRVEAPSWHWLDRQNQARTGLSDELEPGAISDLALSPELAFRVKFDGEIPPTHQLYWRGPVFSFTDGSRWTVSRSEYALHYQDQMQFRGKPYRYTILMEPQDRNWVYALDMPAGYDYPLRRNANYQLLGSHAKGEAAEYAIVSYPEYNTGYLTKTEYRENRQLPEPPSARITELVTRLQGFDGKPEAYIGKVLDYFRRQHFRYTLRPPLMRGHFIEAFLFEARAGFCNHYAAAFVYLMRVAGIPSRIVTGYQGGEFNPLGKFLEVRQANAHAWAEVWLEGRGWVRVDPTTAIAPGRIEQALNAARQIESGAVGLTQAEGQRSWDEWSRLRQVLNGADYQWQRWVVRYGAASQSRVMARLGIGGRLHSLLWLVAAIALVLLSVSVAMSKCPHVPEAPEIRLYRRFCFIMAKAGVRIRPGEGPNAFAVRAKASKPEIAYLIDEATQIFVRLRYHRSPAADDLRQLRNRVKAISRTLKRTNN